MRGVAAPAAWDSRQYLMSGCEQVFQYSRSGYGADLFSHGKSLLSRVHHDQLIEHQANQRSTPGSKTVRDNHSGNRAAAFTQQ